MLKKRYSTAGRIDSVIDLEKLRSGPKSCLERDAAQFFRLTYLTEDFHAMLRSLSRRFVRGHEELPEKRPGLWVDPARRLAVVAGRVHNRPQAPSPSNSMYRHGGLSLMEMLTPWLVLGPKE